MTSNYQIVTREGNRNSFTLIEPFDKLRASSRQSFTLIELLVVLALVAILSVVVVMTLNPAELLKQARDSNRLSDLATINTALNLFSTDVTSGFMGTSTVVYVSLPSTTSTCSNLGLPSLPTGYTYNCVTSANLRNTDGSGWLPVNLGRISSNSPISQLPIDPINTTSSGNYYTYVTGGSWELSSNMESSKQKSVTGASGTDGGVSLSSYEVGNNLRLIPSGILEWKKDQSLVGYWPLDDGTSTVAYDYSGQTALSNGTLTNGPTWESGKIGLGVSLDGVNDYLAVSFAAAKISSGEYTTLVWAKPSSLTRSSLIGGSLNESMLRYFGMYETGMVTTHDGTSYRIGTTACVVGQWCFFGIVVSNNYTNFSLFMNGVPEYSSTTNIAYRQPTSISALGAQVGGTARWFPGLIDDVRIYNRALSAAEIAALYNATK